MYTKKEEIWNTLSHGIGIVLSIIGLILLLKDDTAKTPYSVLSVLLYGLSATLLYTASTMYHAVTKEKWKPLLRKWDHISIYFLIAGTYSPLALISLEQGTGWLIFCVVWGITAVGTLLKIFFTGKFEAISLLLYLFMGWLIVFDFSSVRELHSDLGINLLFAGGAFYTVGAIFYAVKRIPYNHAIWHFFVLGGSVCHFLFIYLDII